MGLKPALPQVGQEASLTGLLPPHLEHSLQALLQTWWFSRPGSLGLTPVSTLRVRGNDDEKEGFSSYQQVVF